MGLVVLVVALAVAVIVSNLNAKHITGVATVTPPPPPPAVSDCALGAFSTSMDLTSTQQSSPPQPVYPNPPTGSCHGTVYGQITAVITNPARVSDAVDADGQDPTTPDAPAAPPTKVYLPVPMPAPPTAIGTFSWLPTPC